MELSPHFAHHPLINTHTNIAPSFSCLDWKCTPLAGGNRSTNTHCTHWQRWRVLQEKCWQSWHTLYFTVVGFFFSLNTVDDCEMVTKLKTDCNSCTENSSSSTVIVKLYTEWAERHYAVHLCNDTIPFCKEHTHKNQQLHSACRCTFVPQMPDRNSDRYQNNRRFSVSVGNNEGKHEGAEE